MSTTINTEKFEKLRKDLIKAKLKYDQVVLSSSLSLEDMVLTDMIFNFVPEIKIITLDTGRLHEETYRLLEDVQKHYGKRIEIYYPNQSNLSEYTSKFGINAFYQSVDLRKKCCEVRKIEPLQRALASADAWITGIRRGQSVTRDAMQFSAWDESFQVQKLNPLLDWSEQDIWDFIKERAVPYNALHDHNYPSIGCEPCTRAIAAGENIRAGRWWWENPETKECGLHRIEVTQVAN